MLLVMSEEDSSRVVIYHIKDAKAETVKPMFLKQVASGSKVETDGAQVYKLIPQWDPTCTQDFVNHLAGEFAKTTSGVTVSSNHVEGVNSHLKRAVRIHNGFRYQRLFLKLDEFVYHKNYSGSGVRCDFLKFIWDIGHFGKKDINHGDG